MKMATGKSYGKDWESTIAKSSEKFIYEKKMFKIFEFL